MQAAGRAIARRRAIALGVASLIFLVGVGVSAVVVVLAEADETSRPRAVARAITYPSVISFMIALAVLKKMWPKGFRTR